MPWLLHPLNLTAHFVEPGKLDAVCGLQGSRYASWRTPSEPPRHRCHKCAHALKASPLLSDPLPTEH